MNLVPNVFPDPPTGYIEIEKIKSSKTWIAPEDGWFRFIGLAASGKGGRTVVASYGTKHCGGGGGGGSGGIIVSDFALLKGDTVHLSVNSGITITNEKTGKTANATAGGDGKDGEVKGAYYGAYGGDGGKGGTASGGNVKNQNGNAGSRGRSTSDLGESSSSSFYGEGDTNSCFGYSTQGGSGNNFPGTESYIVILRGNTNLTQTQLNAIDITTLILNNNRIKQEITGIVLRKNTQ